MQCHCILPERGKGLHPEMGFQICEVMLTLMHHGVGVAVVMSACPSCSGIARMGVGLPWKWPGKSFFGKNQVAMPNDLLTSVGKFLAKKFCKKH